MTGIAFGESPRWHEDRLWFADWAAGEILAVDLEGRSEVVVDLDFPSFQAICFDWLASGRDDRARPRLLRLHARGRGRRHAVHGRPAVGRHREHGQRAAHRAGAGRRRARAGRGLAVAAQPPWGTAGGWPGGSAPPPRRRRITREMAVRESRASW